MSKGSVVHVVSELRDAGGRRHAMTVFDKGELGVLVWAGPILPSAQHKPAGEIASMDYQSRQTVSFMWWQDVIDHFSVPPYVELVSRIAAARGQRDRSGRSAAPQGAATGDG